MIVKIVKQHSKYDVGTTVDVSKNVGFGLIDGGYAIVSRDFTQQDVDSKKKKQRNKFGVKEK